jgi:F0F1-type ATP synthase assembly protein I
MDKEDNDISKTLKEVGPYLGLGVQLAATLVVMIFIGDWLDKKFNTSPIYVLISGCLGIFIGMYNLIKTVTSLDKKNKNNEKN